MKSKKNLVSILSIFLLGVALSVFIIRPLLASAEPATNASMSTETTSIGEGYSPEVREYHLKAAFLRYVAKFVEWPAETLSSDKITLCVLGFVPSFEALNSIDGKVVNDRTIEIMKISTLEQAQSCQILFVTKTEEDKIKQVIDSTQNKSILSYGDMDNFAQKGGCMNFYILNNRLAIMINPNAVKEAKLKIDPRMLRLVTVIPPVEKPTQP